MTRAYFAHPITDYGGPRQAEALASIWSAGWEPVNPDEPSHDAAYRLQGMPYFEALAAGCDLVVFMRFPEGEVGAGVFKEIVAAATAHKPVWEFVPGAGLWLSDWADVASDHSVLNVEQTRALVKRLRNTKR